MEALQKIATSICDAPMIVERFEALTAYCEGWSKGDADMIRSSVSDNYVWEDPEQGRVSKNDLGAFLHSFKKTIDHMRNGRHSASYLILSDWVVDGREHMTTVWCCFAVPGTDIRGLSQIRLGDHGVISEHRAYRTRPHVRCAGIRGKRKGLAQ